MEELFLISVILSENKSKPLFITDDVVFGLEHFNKMKTELGFEKNLTNFEKLPYIKKEKTNEN